ncbi:universal stress domain protein [Burkholderia pseudomallei MSHR5613]|nr:universal stress domain protein [Burkholderia pseudomallei MSHR5613]
MPHALFGHAAEHEPLETAPAVRAEHEQVRAERLRALDDERRHVGERGRLADLQRALHAGRLHFLREFLRELVALLKELRAQDRRVVAGHVVIDRGVFHDVEGLQFRAARPGDVERRVECVACRFAAVDCDKNALIHDVSVVRLRKDRPFGRSSLTTSFYKVNDD